MVELTPPGAYPGEPDRARIDHGLTLAQQLGGATIDPVLVGLEREARPQEPERWLTCAEALVIGAAWWGRQREAMAVLDQATPNWRQALVGEWSARPHRLITSAAVARARQGGQMLECYAVAHDALLGELAALSTQTVADYLRETLQHNVMPGPALVGHAQALEIGLHSVYRWGEQELELRDLLATFAEQGSVAAAHAWWSWLAQDELQAQGPRVSPAPAL